MLESWRSHYPTFRATWRFGKNGSEGDGTFNFDSMSLECSDGEINMGDFAPPFVFHGTSRSNSVVTAMASRITQTDGRLEVDVHTIILGGHIDITAATIVDVRFGFEELNSWADRLPVTTQHHDDGSASAVLSHTLAPSVRFDGASATLQLTSTMSLGRSYRSVVGANERVHLSLDEPQTFEEILKRLVVPTEQAFSLAIGRRVQINALELKSSEVPVAMLNGPPRPHLESLYVFGTERGLAFETNEQLSMASWFQVREGPVPFDHTVQGMYADWMQRRKRYEAVAEAILSPGVDELPPHARLVLICGGLEALHAKLYPRFSQDKPEDSATLESLLAVHIEDAGMVDAMRRITSLHFKPSASSRLRHLICSLPEEAQHSVTWPYGLDDFVAEVGRRRNKVAHTGASTPRNDVTINLCLRLELLARLSLLQDLGLRGRSLLRSMSRDFRHKQLTVY